MNVDALKQKYNIIGNSPLVNQAVEIAMQVAPSDVTVLILGENGVGKDVFSRIIHQNSIRKHKPFIPINCGAIPEGTIDSELFGHEKGSFTSAYDARKGYFEEADGGVVFLDEIAEMPMSTQARLLRLLENGEFLRVGSSKVQKTDVRIVAATNKNLVQAITQEKFREDLYYRLNTVSIFVPPLRERGSDIELLFRFFASGFAEKYGRKPVRLSESALPLMYKYRWPGNVRELRNFVEKLSVLVQDDYVQDYHLEQHLIIPESSLPTLSTQHFQQNQTQSKIDNEFLLKFLIEVKKDLQEIKMLLHDENQHISTHETVNNDWILNAYNKEIKVEGLPLLDEPLSLEKKEKDLIIKALNKFQNNRRRAAEELGISERTLYRKLKSYGLE